MADGITPSELQLAARNHGMPLEALRHGITPVGLHYLLVHYDIPVVDPDEWRLEIGGRVERPLTLRLEELTARTDTITTPVTMECAGNGRALLDPRPVSQPWLLEAVGNAAWTGVPLGALLSEAGVADGAVEVLFTGMDRGVEGGVEQQYERSLALDVACAPEVLLAFAINGAPLPPQHGFPLRLLVPGWYGMTSVKWLERITVLDAPYDGYQNARAYRWREREDDPGEPVTRIQPRALLAPPGIPDFMTRRRFVEPGPVRVTGRAWSGWGEIDRVEVSADGGAAWDAARLGVPAGPHSWTPWSYEWDARPGEHVLCCRAGDTSGRSQPDGPRWNVGGYANTEVQRVCVVVRGSELAAERRPPA
jgi:DMSO/TMAO reductase YedYZ molybdopterin-dependent catalytic subunit